MNLPKARVLQVAAAVLLVTTLAAAILIIQARVPRTLIMATGPAGSAYALYGEQYRLLLARSGVDEAIEYHKSGIRFLQRYLPFGIAVLVGPLTFVLIPLVGVLYPALKLAPGLYGWAIRMRIVRLYGELKVLEHELNSDPSNERKRVLRDQVEQLERRVGQMRFPNAYAHLVYKLRLHINLVRSRL